jgi:hypothetical protein
MTSDEIMHDQHDAAKRGFMVVWTIYNRPTDHPDGHIARKFESGKGGVVATDMTVEGELDDIRITLWNAGLVRLARNVEDEPQIIESWL